jgi:hypothetical protein
MGFLAFTEDAFYGRKGEPQEEMKWIKNMRM